MRKRLTIRFVNGVISAVIVVFFLGHAALGDAWMFGLVPATMSSLIWAGIALIALHVLVSVITSIDQISDPEYPASDRKKRHLAIKWATGIAISLVAFLHIDNGRSFDLVGGFSPLANTVVLVVLAIALAVHACVGAKSLLTDLDIDRRFKCHFASSSAYAQQLWRLPPSPTRCCEEGHLSYARTWPKASRKSAWSQAIVSICANACRALPQALHALTVERLPFRNGKARLVRCGNRIECRIVR